MNRTIKELFRAGFFAGLGFITAFLLVCLVIFLAGLGFSYLISFVNSVTSRTPTPEAALQQLIKDKSQYQVIAKRKLLDNSENKELIVFCSSKDTQYVKACIQGKSNTTVSCIVGVQRLGGWEVAQINNGGNCLSMLQIGQLP